MDCSGCKYIRSGRGRVLCGNPLNWNILEYRLRTIESCSPGCEYYDESLGGVFEKLSKLDPGEPYEKNYEGGEVDKRKT